jgi:hypothetical protein
MIFESSLELRRGKFTIEREDKAIDDRPFSIDRWKRFTELLAVLN